MFHLVVDTSYQVALSGSATEWPNDGRRSGQQLQQAEHLLVVEPVVCRKPSPVNIHEITTQNKNLLEQGCESLLTTSL